MRTTVDIPDPLYRRLKIEAAQRGCSVKELVLRGVRTELEGGKGAGKNTVSNSPLSNLSGLAGCV